MLLVDCRRNGAEFQGAPSRASIVVDNSLHRAISCDVLANEAPSHRQQLNNCPAAIILHHHHHHHYYYYYYHTHTATSRQELTMSNANTQPPTTAAAAARQQNARPTSSDALGTTSSTETFASDSDSTLINLTPRIPSGQSTARASPEPEEEEVRCWICFVSKGEETDRSRGEWRAPCKCTLVAHEACLLDWIADMQKTGVENGSSQKPACPQCKTPIRLKEEQSMVLDMVDSAGRVAGKAGAFVAFGGMIYDFATSGLRIGIGV
jgi:hypothetical protein